MQALRPGRLGEVGGAQAEAAPPALTITMAASCVTIPQAGDEPSLDTGGRFLLGWVSLSADLLPDSQAARIVSYGMEKHPAAERQAGDPQEEVESVWRWGKTGLCPGPPGLQGPAAQLPGGGIRCEHWAAALLCGGVVLLLLSFTLRTAERPSLPPRDGGRVQGDRGSCK